MTDSPRSSFAPSTFSSRIREIKNPVDALAADLLVHIDEHAPDHRVICAIVRPSGKLAAVHNLANRAEAAAILRQLADLIESTEGE